MDNIKEINCKEIFKKAYENRYTWKNDFHGYQGKCTFFNNDEIYKGDFVLGKDFKPNIQNIEDEKVVKSIASQLFEVCIHSCLLYTSPSPRDLSTSRMPSSA